VNGGTFLKNWLFLSESELAFSQIDEAKAADS
jgi:hypothetical protein